MSEIFLSHIPQHYYISNEKIYTSNNDFYKISNTVNKFDSQNFAQWMKTGFADSKFKSQKELVKAAKSNPATISRLMTASPQSINNKASQPDKELVIRLAEIFQRDEDEALVLAGYAPNSFENAETTDFDETVRVQLLGAKNFSDEDKREYMEAFQVAYEIAKRRIADKKKQAV